MRLDPRVAAVRSAVGRVLAELDDASPVLVACSGGPDSLALAGAAGFHARRRPGPVGAVIVDHGLQQGSGQIARQAAQMCSALGLDPVRVETVTVDGTANVEAGARTARYAALYRVAHEVKASAILLGHTMDDQAETVLLGLVRGSGARSLAGMAPQRGLLHRPLLGLSRTEVAAAADLMLDAAGVAARPWQDPHNRDDAFVRARVRHHLLPVLREHLGQAVTSSLARTADLLRDDADLLESQARDLLAAARRPDGVSTQVLEQAHPALRRRALHQFLIESGCAPGQLGIKQMLAMDRLLTDWRGQGPVGLPGRRQGGRSCGRLWVTTPSTHGDSR